MSSSWGISSLRPEDSLPVSLMLAFVLFVLLSTHYEPASSFSHWLLILLYFHLVQIFTTMPAPAPGLLDRPTERRQAGPRTGLSNLWGSFQVEPPPPTAAPQSPRTQQGPPGPRRGSDGCLSPGGLEAASRQDQGCPSCNPRAWREAGAQAKVSE